MGAIGSSPSFFSFMRTLSSGARGMVVLVACVKKVFECPPAMCFKLKRVIVIRIERARRAVFGLFRRHPSSPSVAAVVSQATSLLFACCVAVSAPFTFACNLLNISVTYDLIILSRDLALFAASRSRNRTSAQRVFPQSIDLIMCQGCRQRLQSALVPTLKYAS